MSEIIITAETDALTQVHNRLRIEKYLSALINDESINDFNVVLIDLDKFKYINDKYGHLKGDEVLIKFANIVRSNIREVDFFGRWGGDEFILILTDISDRNIPIIINKLKIEINKNLVENEVVLDFSYGIHSYEK